MDALNISPLPEMIFYIPHQLWDQMQTFVSQGAPLETCGLVAGVVKQKNYYAKTIIPVTNILHSPTRYRMDPKEQLEAFNRIEDLEQVLLSIYHAHPQGPDRPSPTDIDEAYYPECVYLIWSGRTGTWGCRGYLIQAVEVTEVKLRITERT